MEALFKQGFCVYGYENAITERSRCCARACGTLMHEPVRYAVTFSACLAIGPSFQ
ncbi:MAG: hypothetical protein KDI45_11670 [Candidatus Accumulibacter sp.]|nr:hypothetical protein [Accumulibacter sp.]MCB1968410.1 hypothetical protein [Accumulibacter sp.]